MENGRGEGDVAARHRPSVPAQKLLISNSNQYTDGRRQAEPPFLWPPAVHRLVWLPLHHTTPLFSSPLILQSRGRGGKRDNSRSFCREEWKRDGSVCVIRAEGSPDVVQLRVRRRRRRPALGAGHVGVHEAPVGGAAAAVAGEDGQCERGEGDLRAAGGGGAQHRRAQALQPAQGEGNRAALPGDHRVLQDHRRRPEAEAGTDPPRQEERREARFPRLTISMHGTLRLPMNLSVT